MRRVLLVALAGCVPEAPTERRPDLRAAAPAVEKADPLPQESIPPDATLPGDGDHPPPWWEGAEWWCFNTEHALNPAECSGLCGLEVNTGREQRCIKPWWRDGWDGRICVPKMLTKPEREVVRESLAEHITREYPLGATSLSKFFAVVAARESSWRESAVHRLNPDLESSNAAWRRLSKTYYKDSQHRLESWWQTYGLLGQNSALYVLEMDRQAPPTILCRKEVAVEAYLRRMRRTWKKLQHGVECEGEVFHGLADGKPSWTDLHRSGSIGKICPHPRDTRFERRARAVGLRPREEVRLRWLGPLWDPAKARAEGSWTP